MTKFTALATDSRETLLLSRGGMTRAIIGRHIIEKLDNTSYFHPIAAATNPYSIPSTKIAAILEELQIPSQDDEPIYYKSLNKSFNYVFRLTDDEVDNTLFIANSTVNIYWHLTDVSCYSDNSNMLYNLLEFVIMQLYNRVRDFMNIHYVSQWKEASKEAKEQKLRNIHDFHLSREISFLGNTIGYEKADWQSWLQQRLQKIRQEVRSQNSTHYSPPELGVHVMRDQERIWVAQNRKKLTNRYSGQYIAVVGTKVVASAEDLNDLTSKIPKRIVSPYIEYLPKQAQPEAHYWIF